MLTSSLKILQRVFLFYYFLVLLLKATTVSLLKMLKFDYKNGYMTATLYFLCHPCYLYFCNNFKNIVCQFSIFSCVAADIFDLTHVFIFLCQLSMCVLHTDHVRICVLMQMEDTGAPAVLVDVSILTGEHAVSISAVDITCVISTLVTETSTSATVIT